MTESLRKNKFIMFLMSVIISFGVLFSTGVTNVYADKNSAGADGIEVTIGANGNLEIKGDSFSANNSGDAWTKFIGKYRTFIVGISGIGAVSMILFFIMQFMKLGASAGNPSARQQALVGVLWSGVAAAGLGAVAIIVGFFYNAFR